MKITVRNGASYFFVLATLITLCIPQTKSSAATNDLFDKSATAFAENDRQGFVNNSALTIETAISTNSTKTIRNTKISLTNSEAKVSTASTNDIKVEKTAVSSESALSYTNFTATAYCLKGRTALGSGVRRGVIAADPRVLPLGTRVHISAGNWSGSYTVTDTGGAIRGRKIDIWVPNSSEARSFGRRSIKVAIMGKK